MFEQQTYDAILARMLATVPSDVDKREGSIIYDALAPAAAELAQTYISLDVLLGLVYADTATGVYLERRTAEHGVERAPATKALRRGIFYGEADTPIDVAIGSRFAAGDVRYKAVSRLAAGQFALECESAGNVGNQPYGRLLPIDFVNGLVRAELTDVLTPGEEAETDAALRQRFYGVINEQPFGGNVTDYKQKLGAIPGVGGVKIFPAWQGGGTVKATLIASDFNPPSSELVEEVQTLIDPTLNSGEGIGFAPIGHQVTITGVNGITIGVETTLTLLAGTTIGQVQNEVTAVIENYLQLLRQTWADESGLIVRVSQLEARVLTVSGVTDISGTTLNGNAGNITLTDEQVPLLGAVTLHD